jgi:DNA (cytosine-5)-methyltransferase 1
MARIIGEIRPAFAFVENSPELVRRGLTTVVSRFAEMGYDSKWGVIGARHLSAMHKRDRLWIVATNIQDANSVRRNCELGRYVSRSRWKPKYAAAYLAGASDREPWILGRHHGVAYIMDRLKSIGNGQVPAVAALSWNVLTDNMDTNAKNMEAHGQD